VVQKKSDLIYVLVRNAHSEPPNFVDIKLLDGAAVVHLLPTVNAAEYADQVFLIHIIKQLKTFVYKLT